MKRSSALIFVLIFCRSFVDCDNAYDNKYNKDGNPVNIKARLHMAQVAGTDKTINMDE